MSTIKKSYKNAYDKASKTSYFRTFEPDRYVAENRFSGVEFVLDEFELSIYNFCLNWYERYEQGIETEVPVSVYDNLRYYFMTINPRAYMELLD